MVDADTFNFDYGAGTGSLNKSDAEYDETTPSEHDGRSATRTWFKSTEKKNDDFIEVGEEFHRHWEWLCQLNEGNTQYSGAGYGERTRRADARRFALTYASQLGMGKVQKERVLHQIDSLESLHQGSIPMEGTVLAIISLVANEDGWMIRSPSKDDDDNRGPSVEVTRDGVMKEVALFTKLVYDCGVTPKEIRTVRENIRSRQAEKDTEDDLEGPSNLTERISWLDEPWRDKHVLTKLADSDMELRHMAETLGCEVPALIAGMEDNGLDIQQSHRPIRGNDDPISYGDDDDQRSR